MAGALVGLQALPLFFLFALPTSPHAQVNPRGGFFPGGVDASALEGVVPEQPYGNTISGGLSIQMNPSFFNWVQQQITTCLLPPPGYPGNAGRSVPGSCMVPDLTGSGPAKFPFRLIQDELDGQCLLNGCMHLLGSGCPANTSWWTVNAFVDLWVRDGGMPGWPTPQCNGTSYSADPVDCTVLYYDRPQVSLTEFNPGTQTFSSTPSPCLSSPCSLSASAQAGLGLSITLDNTATWAGHPSGDAAMCGNSSSKPCVWFQALPAAIGDSNGGYICPANLGCPTAFGGLPAVNPGACLACVNGSGNGCGCSCSAGICGPGSCGCANGTPIPGNACPGGRTGCGTCLGSNGNGFGIVNGTINAWATVQNISLNATAVPWVNDRSKCYQAVAGWTASSPSTEPSCIDFAIHDACGTGTTVYTATVSSVSIPGVNACALSCSIFGIDPCAAITSSIVASLGGTIAQLLQNTLNNTIGSLLKGFTELPMDLIKSLFGCACRNPLNCTGYELETCAFHFAQSYWNTGLYPKLAYNATLGGFTIGVDSILDPISPSTSYPGGITYPWGSCSSFATPAPKYYRAPSVAWTSANAPNGQPYMIGLGISRDFVANLVYALYLSGTLCLNLSADPAAPSGSPNNMFPTLGGLLNVNSFGGLVPALRRAADPGSYVKVTMTPVGTPDVHFSYDTVVTAYPPGLDNYRTSPTSTGTYDVSVDLPDWQMDFWIKQSGVYQDVLSVKWPWMIGLALDWNAQRNGFDFLLDVTHTDWQTGFKFGQPGSISFPGGLVTTAQSVRGVGDILPMLMSAGIATTNFFSSNLAGLFGMGVSLPYASLQPYDAVATGYAYQLLYLNVTGNLDFVKLFGLFGSFAAPPERAPNVRVIPPLPTRAEAGGAVLAALSHLSGEPSGSPLYASPDVGPFEFQATDPRYDPSQLSYRWRMDGGAWHPRTVRPDLSFRNLLEGRHVLEVASENPDHWVSAEPSRVEFSVDSVPPDLSIEGAGLTGAEARDGAEGRVAGGEATFETKTWDWQTPDGEIRVASRLDDGAWTPYGVAKTIPLAGLKPGGHVLQVRAVDLAGNESMAARPFQVVPPSAVSSLLRRAFGCGCSVTAPGPTPIEGAVGAIPYLGLLLFVFRRRRHG